jgi:phytoene/squalene synthetase
VPESDSEKLRAIDERTRQTFELVAAMAELHQETRARVWVMEAFSRAAWRAQIPVPMKKQIVEQFLANLRAIDVAGHNPEFAALVHDATRELLEALGEAPTGQGVQ